MRPELKKKIEQREHVLNRVNELLISALKLDQTSAELDPETPLFGSGLRLDSLDAVELIVELESEFRISISEDEGLLALRTINSLVDMVLSKKKMNLTTEYEVGYRAIRNSVALAEEPELRCIQLTGDGALEALDTVCPCDMFLQDGQMRHTLLLDQEGVPFADVYACREGENAFLLGYGPDAYQITDWITLHATGIADFSIVDLMESYYSLALDGPYAWELCAEVFGPDVLGLPYLGMIVLGKVIVFRAGRTGEYGYHLLVPSNQKSEWLEKLCETGKAFDMVWADETVRDQCVLENFFFDYNREGSFGLTPMELQLQWRLSLQKTNYIGAQAIRKLRKSGWSQRLTCFVIKESVKPGEEITCDGEPVGSVLAAGYSPLRGDYVGKALLHRPYWHAGLDVFLVGERPLKTISAPAIDNLSLKITPYRHSYHTRKEDLK